MGKKAPSLWVAGLAAIAAALTASPALASGIGQPSSPSARVTPLPMASWHGRPIRRPEPAAGAAALAVASRGASAAPLRIGSGYGQLGGSAAVREVQRLLHRIGYRCGPVDGLFGPLTRASVQWFQIKHGLRPSGVVGSVTLAFLQLRATGAALPGKAGSQLRAGPPHPATAVVHRSSPKPHPVAHRHTAPRVLAVGAAGLVALLAGGILLGRRQRPHAQAGPSRKRRRQSSPIAPSQSARAVGYVTGRGRGETRRRAQAIERACSQRGWTLARMVREGRDIDSQGGERPGLAFALDQLAEGAGDRLVASRLQDLGTTRRDLASLLAWCSRSEVDLIALDVGLDTGTSEGRLAARCLVAVGDRAKERPRRRAREPSQEGRKRATGNGTINTAPAVRT
jgi:hypothetical protein